LNNYSAERTNANVLTLRFDNFSADFEQWFLLSSDRHHDSTYCDRSSEKKHLDEALKRDAIIFDGGDLFDSMQGKFDPRRSMDELRPEYRVNNYYDFVVKDCADFYEPYAKNWVLFGLGNHETAVIKNAGTHLTDRLVYELNKRGCTNSFTGGFGGWIRLLFSLGSKGGRASLCFYYHHSGITGNAPVTKGMIGVNRQSVFIPDADIVLNGHNHEAYYTSQVRQKLTNAGNITHSYTHFVRTPGYKKSWDEASYGFDIEKLQPKPIGAAWMKITHEFDKHTATPHISVTMDMM
jgi:hypothetical protein